MHYPKYHLGKHILRFVAWCFVRPCPNCESAWTGGSSAPEDIKWCLMCSSPKTGVMRGWSWRWSWLARRTTKANYLVARGFNPQHLTRRGLAACRFALRTQPVVGPGS